MPLYILERTIDGDKYKVSSINKKASKDKMALALGKENRYTKLLLLSGKLKANKKVIIEKQLSEKTKNEVITAAEFEMGMLMNYGYYGMGIKEKRDNSYKISVEEYFYTQSIFERYTCDVIRIIFENKTIKKTIVLDSKDYTIYSLIMELSSGVKAGQGYSSSMNKISKSEIYAYLKPFDKMDIKTRNLNIRSADNCTPMSVGIKIVTKNDMKIKEKIKENEYQITEKDGSRYYTRLEKKPKSLKFQLLPVK